MMIDTYIGIGIGIDIDIYWYSRTDTKQENECQEINDDALEMKNIIVTASNLQNFALSFGNSKVFPKNLYTDSKIFALSCWSSESFSAAFSANRCLCVFSGYTFLHSGQADT